MDKNKWSERMGKILGATFLAVVEVVIVSLGVAVVVGIWRAIL